MRLIDADKLVVDARLGDDETPYVSKAQIDEAPTVEAIPVVRCKDCEHYDDGLCRRWKYSHVTDEDGFCNCGAKMEAKEEKMSLINKNKLRKDILDMPNCCNGYSDTYDKSFILTVIDEAEEVEAIPIEFIKQLIEKFDCERGNAIKDTYAHILSALLEFWEFEQEKENEINN